MAFRKQLLDMLGEPRTVSSLARELGVTRRDIEDDLQHLILSARTAGYRITVQPARCKSCDFVFGEDKLTKPGKCPACRQTRVYEPLIKMEKVG